MARRKVNKNNCQCMYCGAYFKLDYRNRKGCCIKCEQLTIKLLLKEGLNKK
jgi:hypothetical protein